MPAFQMGTMFWLILEVAQVGIRAVPKVDVLTSLPACHSGSLLSYP